MAICLPTEVNKTCGSNEWKMSDVGNKSFRKINEIGNKK